MSSQLPKNWVGCEIGDVAKVVGGSTPPSKDPTNFTTPGGIPWITPADLSGYKDAYISKGARNLSEKGYSVCSAVKMPAGSVLFSSRAPVGYVAIASAEVTTNQGFKSFVLPALIDSRFVYYYLRHIKPIAEMMATGTTFKELSGSVAAKLPFVFAPLNEQKRITDKLDALLSRVDACRERLDRVPQILKRFRQAVLTAATSGALSEEWRKRNSLKRNWSRARLSEIGELGRGKSKHRPRNDPRLYGGTYPFIQTGDVAQSGGTIHFHTQTYSDFGLAQSKLWPAGTVCITIAANIADTAILSYPACFPDSVVGFIANPLRCLPQFVKWSIDVIRAELEAFAPATAQKNINLAVLNNVEFELPTLDEQHEIVRRVESLFVFADRLEARYTAGRAQADQLTPSLLDKAFRGELVPQDANDEPAKKLLERIQAAKSSEMTKPKRKASGRKPMTMKITTETVKKAIQQMPQDRFSFEELREALPADYESLKDAIFELIRESEILSQFFDSETESIRFKRSQR